MQNIEEPRMSRTSQEELIESLRAFADERDWEQFHNPKNLSMALVVEAGELVEIFQWLTVEEAQAVMDNDASALRVREELADVYAYLLRIADVLGVSLDEALEAKIDVNGQKYPVETSKGSASKYQESSREGRGDWQ